MTTGIDESDLLRAVLMAEAGSRGGRHLELELLADYSDGALDQESEERVRDHLVGCRRCADRLLGLDALLQAEAAPDSPIAELEIEAAWRRFLDLSRAAESPGKATAPPRWATALAASMAVATLSLGLWSLRLQRANNALRRQVVEASLPTVNMPVLYLDVATRTAEAAKHRLEVPQSAGRFALFFAVADLRPADEYEVQFLDAEAKPLRRLGGLMMNDSGGLRLGLPRGFLPAGDYRILVRARQGDEWRSVKEYPSTIVYR